MNSIDILDAEAARIVAEARAQAEEADIRIEEEAGIWGGPQYAAAFRPS